MLCIVPAADEGCVGQVPEQDHHHWNQVLSDIIACFAKACLNFPQELVGIFSSLSKPRSSMDGTQMLLPMGDRTVLIWSHHGAQWSECAKIAQQWGKTNEVKSLGNRSISDNQFLENINYKNC